MTFFYLTFECIVLYYTYIEIKGETRWEQLPVAILAIGFIIYAFCQLMGSIKISNNIVDLTEIIKNQEKRIKKLEGNLKKV